MKTKINQILNKKEIININKTLDLRLIFTGLNKYCKKSISFKTNRNSSKLFYCIKNKYFNEILKDSKINNEKNKDDSANTLINDNNSNKVNTNTEDLNFMTINNIEINPAQIKIYNKDKKSSEKNSNKLESETSSSSNEVVKINEEDGIKPLNDSDLILDPNSPTYLEDMKKLPRNIQHIEFHKHLMLKRKKAESKRLYNQRVLMALGFLLIGMYVFWVPLYRAVCEHAGFLVKTSVSDYKDYNKNINLGRKFKVNFEGLVDDDLEWEFFPEQKFVYVNAGETCLIFYKAKNKTNKPIVGLSVYDVHPQSCALYFNKVQCFCFENQMLGPNEEVDLPVLFYLDPTIQEDKYVIDYGHYDLNLKYTFYYAKKQDLAKIMKKRLSEEKEFENELNKRKTDLNTKYGYEKYLIEENKSTLPGVNPLLRDFKISEM